MVYASCSYTDHATFFFFFPPILLVFPNGRDWATLIVTSWQATGINYKSIHTTCQTRQIEAFSQCHLFPMLRFCTSLLQNHAAPDNPFPQLTIPAVLCTTHAKRPGHMVTLSHNVGPSTLDGTILWYKLLVASDRDIITVTRRLENSH